MSKDHFNSSTTASSDTESSPFSSPFLCPPPIHVMSCILTPPSHHQLIGLTMCWKTRAGELYDDRTLMIWTEKEILSLRCTPKPPCLLGKILRIKYSIPIGLSSISMLSWDISSPPPVAFEGLDATANCKFSRASINWETRRPRPVPTIPKRVRTASRVL